MPVRSRRFLYADPLADYLTGSIDHIVLGAASYQTDYQTKIRVYRGYGVNSGNTVYIPPSELLASYNDLRFADDVGRLLPYWIESIGTNYADIWVKLYQIPTTGAVVRVLFGGGAIGSGSNGSSTFLFFDDFEDAAVGAIWTASGSVDESSGTVQCDSGESVASVATFGRATALRAKTKTTNNAGWSGAIAYGSGVPISGNYEAYAIGVFQNSFSWLHNNGSAYISNTNIGSATTDTWYNLEFCLKSTGADGYFWQYGADRGAAAVSEPAGTFVGKKLWIGGHNSAAKQYCDFIFLRSWISPEPSHGWWGSLEDL